MGAKPHIKACVTRRFSAEPERVFDAWLDAGMLGKWMFGPAVREEEVARLDLDPREGGSFSFVVRRKGEEIDHVGKYVEIDRPRRLVFTWGVPKQSPNSARVLVDIIPLDTGCQLNLTHELHPDCADYASRTQAAWTKMLEALADTLG